MDAQLKRGIIEVCVLKDLERQDNYGYQLVQDLQGVIDISESTLYPILRRLEEQECLTVYSIEHNGRLRRYYRITEKGRSAIADFLKEWSDVMVVYDFIKRGKKQ
jgi:PadR family transcriptional regulator, regulatory protein PadR